ncbi:MAG TPA: shikimate dehydrogenase [Clostridiales bacterium]|nr:shikimate dehydrogenase [Clostridiales bacterium]
MNHKYGLIGYPLGHSYSPRIHQAIFQSTDFLGEYSLFEIAGDKIPKFFHNLKQGGLEGFNVTIPYKQTVIPYMDDLSPEAQRIGAVNTVRITSGGLKGYNTDYIGFKALLLESCGNVFNKNVLILGDGGSARTVYTCMCDLGVSTCYMVSRKADRIKASFPEACVVPYEAAYDLKDLYLTVNCTPVGMFPHVDAAPLDIERMDPFPYYVDLIYNPARTLMMENVEKAGGKAINGLYMLISQAVAAQEIWRQEQIHRDITKKVQLMIERSVI